LLREYKDKKTKKTKPKIRKKILLPNNKLNTLTKEAAKKQTNNINCWLLKERHCYENLI
jgi:hypothetical protein